MSEKMIMASQRGYVFLLEKCKIVSENGNVFAIHSNSPKQNIPKENTMFIMLGCGTSITNEAVRALERSNCPFCFVGSLSGKFYAGNVTPITMSNEDRPTEYVQRFFAKISDVNTRLFLAKQFLTEQFKNIVYLWNDKCLFADYGIYADMCINLQPIEDDICNKTTIQELISYEGVKKKNIYKYLSQEFNINFTMVYENPHDKINQFLNVGNSILYGYANTMLWNLGIPVQFPILHGMTNRGGLIYDVADLWKTALVTPLAFISNEENLTIKEFRDRLILLCSNDKCKILRKMFLFFEEICK